MILGCIADDFTGATDLAALLVRAGASAGQHAVTYVKQSTKEQSHSRHAIVANPAVKVAASNAARPP